MRYFITAALLAFSALTISAKDKYEEVNFPLFAHVISADTETVQTGAREITNPACINTGDNQILKGYCAQAGHRIENTSVNRSLVTVEIGDFVYKLSGRMTLMPGDYHARQTKHGFEVLCRKNDGKPKISKYWIESVRKR